MKKNTLDVSPLRVCLRAFAVLFQALRYSGNGLPLVSGATQMTRRPTT